DHRMVVTWISAMPISALFAGGFYFLISLFNSVNYKIRLKQALYLSKFQRDILKVAFFMKKRAWNASSYLLYFHVLKMLYETIVIKKNAYLLPLNSFLGCFFNSSAFFINIRNDCLTN